MSCCKLMVVLLLSACGNVARDDALERLQQDLDELRVEKEELRQALEALTAHERALATEIVAEAAAADLGDFANQLQSSRLDNAAVADCTATCASAADLDALGDALGGAIANHDQRIADAETAHGLLAIEVDQDQTARAAEYDALEQRIGAAEDALEVLEADLWEEQSEGTVLEERVDRHEDRLTHVEATLGTLATDADAEQTARMEADAELWAAVDPISSLLPAGGRSMVGYVDTDTLLRVPDDYADIHAALATLDGVIISPSATVTIEVGAAGCDVNYTKPIEVRHPSGAQIAIVATTPSPCVLAFVGTPAGLVVDRGYTLGAFKGFLLRGTAAASEASGVEVSQRSALLDGAGLQVEGWPDAGFEVSGVSYADLGLSRSVENDGDGYRAVANAVLYATGGKAIDCGNAGMWVSDGAFLFAFEATVSGSDGDGFGSTFGGLLVADKSVSSNNVGPGFDSYGMGAIQANSSTSENYSDHGYAAGEGSYLAAHFSSAVGDGGYAAFDHSVMLLQRTDAISDSEGRIGYSAENMSFINARYSDAVGWDQGFDASNLSSIMADHSTSIGYGQAYAAGGMSFMSAIFGEADSITSHGLSVSRGSVASAAHMNVTQSLLEAYHAVDGGIIDALDPEGIMTTSPASTPPFTGAECLITK